MTNCMICNLNMKGDRRGGVNKLEGLMMSLVKKRSFEGRANIIFQQKIMKTKNCIMCIYESFSTRP